VELTGRVEGIRQLEHVSRSRRDAPSWHQLSTAWRATSTHGSIVFEYSYTCSAISDPLTGYRRRCGSRMEMMAYLLVRRDVSGLLRKTENWAGVVPDHARVLAD